MTTDEMVQWFNSAPELSRHERVLWAARKIAHLTGITEGRAYQMLLIPAWRHPWAVVGLMVLMQTIRRYSPALGESDVSARYA